MRLTTVNPSLYSIEKQCSCHDTSVLLLVLLKVCRNYVGERRRIICCCHRSAAASFKTNRSFIITLVFRYPHQSMQSDCHTALSSFYTTLYKNMSHIQPSVCFSGCSCSDVNSYDGKAEFPIICSIFCVQSWEMPGPMRTCSRQQRGLSGFATTIM